MSKVLFALYYFVITPNVYLGENNNSTRRMTSNQQKVYQYMAVCTDGHGVLSPWVDTQLDANKYGKDHEVLTKGHRWKIDTREKPQPKRDSTYSKL